VIFVEVHSATTHGVSEVQKKLEWLKSFLRRRNMHGLTVMPHEYHWVASGRIRIPRHTRQYKQLAQLRRRQALQGPHRHLRIE
jgi:hypothetical protein